MSGLLTVIGGIVLVTVCVTGLLALLRYGAQDLLDRKKARRDVKNLFGFDDE